MSDKLPKVDKNEFVTEIITCVIMGVICGILLTCALGSIGFFQFDKTQNTSKQDELNYAPTAQKPNDILDTREDKKTVQNAISNNTDTSIYWNSYMAELQRRIKLNWEPPEEGRDKTVKVMFRISKEGNLLAYEITKSSGITEVDRAAVQAIQLTAPFKPLPEEFKGESVDIKFTFDYHKI